MVQGSANQIFLLLHFLINAHYAYRPCEFLETVSFPLPPIAAEKERSESGVEESSSDDDEELFRNTNHPPEIVRDTSSSESDCDET